MAEASPHANEPIRGYQNGDNTEGATDQRGDVEGEELVFAEVVQVRFIPIQSRRHVCASVCLSRSPNERLGASTIVISWVPTVLVFLFCSWL